MNLHELIDRLHKEHTLTKEEFITLIKERNEESASYLASLAREEAVNIYGNGVFPRGLVEFTNYCKNNCYNQITHHCFRRKRQKATTRRIIQTVHICSSERKRRACRRSFWLRITTAASAFPSVRRHGASTSAIPPPSAYLRRCGSRISRI